MLHITIEYNCKIFGASCYYAIPDNDQWKEDALSYLQDLQTGKAVTDGQLKPNSTRDVFLSLFRSRDDNLVWVSCALLNAVIKKLSPENLAAIGFSDIDSPQCPAIMLVGMIHSLLSSESEFRIATIRGLSNLLQNIAKSSGLDVSKLDPKLRESLNAQANNKLDQLIGIAGAKTTGGILNKNIAAIAEEYE
jgi:hypothetical protein